MPIKRDSINFGDFQWTIECIRNKPLSHEKQCAQIDKDKVSQLMKDWHSLKYYQSTQG